MAFNGNVVEIPLGQGGLNGTSNRSQIAIDELASVRNVTYENGLIEKEGGSEKYNTVISANLSGATVVGSLLSTTYDASATSPSGIAVDTGGITLWVADIATLKIYNINRSAVLQSSFATSAYDSLATLPLGLASAPDGNLWITDGNTRKCYNVSPSGVLISSFTTSFVPSGIAVKSDGNLLVTGYDTKTVYTLSTTGTQISSFLSTTFDSAYLSQIRAKADIPPLAETVVYRTPAHSTTKLRVAIANRNAVPVLVRAAITDSGTLAQAKDYFLYDTELLEHETRFLNIALEGDQALIVHANTQGVSVVCSSVNMSRPTGVTEAQDGSLWFVDATTKSIFHTQADGLLLRRYELTDYSSTADIPIDIGIDTDDTFWLTDGGVLYHLDASTLFNIIGGHDWHPSTAVQRQVVYTSAGSLLRDDGDGSFPIALKQSLAGDVVPTFTEGGGETQGRDKKLFITNNQDPVQVISGDSSTTTDLAFPPADWTGGNQPAFCFLHNGRLCGGGNRNDPHRFYMSSFADHEDFQDSAAWQTAIYSGEGEGLVAGVSFKGLAILFKKPFGVYVVNTTPVSSLDWVVTRLNLSTGLCSPKAVVVIDNDVLFLDSTGNFQIISAVQQFGDVSVRNLSLAKNMSSWVRKNINTSLLHKTQAVWYGAKREAHFCVAKKGSLVQDMRIIIDFNTDTPRFRISDQNVNESIWLAADLFGIQRPLCGDDDATVWRLDREVKSKDGEGFAASYKTADIDLSHLDRRLGVTRKQFDSIEIEYETHGHWDVDIDIIQDGKLTQTIPFDMGGGGAVLGSFILGKDVLSSPKIFSRKHRLAGSCKRFALEVRSNAASQDFGIARAFVYFKAGNERPALPHN